ncbi:unnamed protein product [Prunus armeniaca]|uniref:Phosphoglycerate mutase family protein n=1 Tax=Prunus armeniaca TaxID=36596 RepID=A0A6J5UHD2_PRUAR|nr:unnamed protein product [Prunus armeniaca]
MNAVTLCNHNINFNIQHHFSASVNPNWPKSSSIRRRNPNTATRPSSLVIETVEGKAVSDSEQTPPYVARRLILLRHANSSWEDPSLKDHDRPLSETGQADAVKVSHKLQQLGWIPQLILSSNAVRTRETLTIMQQQVRGFLEAEVHYISSFYSIAAMDGQTAEHLQHVICNYSRDDILTVMCMGHNRGWEEAASMFTGASIELKTCNAALLETTGKSWDETGKVKKKKKSLKTEFTSRVEEEDFLSFSPHPPPFLPLILLMKKTVKRGWEFLRRQSGSKSELAFITKKNTGGISSILSHYHHSQQP